MCQVLSSPRRTNWPAKHFRGVYNVWPAPALRSKFTNGSWDRRILVFFDRFWVGKLSHSWVFSARLGPFLSPSKVHGALTLICIANGITENDIGRFQLEPGNSNKDGSVWWRSRAAIMTLKLQQRRHCIDRLPLLQLVFEQGPPITSSCFTPGQEWKRLIFKNSWELDPKTVSTANHPAICAKDSHHHQSFPNKVP